MNFYNEIDPFAAAWLRELIKAGHVAPGIVDERSIEDITPDELRQYTQCHFFAGIGVWSYALRQAGWPDDRPVWTGSCPCQPFSAAGKRTGTADERHLWPAWFHLISERKPNVIFGEQVEAAIRQGWLDLVQADLEGVDYTFGATCLPACGFGAPHIRQRLFFVAHSESNGLLKQAQRDECSNQSLWESNKNIGPELLDVSVGKGEASTVGDSSSVGRQQLPNELCGGNAGVEPRRRQQVQLGEASKDTSPDGPRLEGYAGDVHRRQEREDTTGSIATPSGVNGFWRDADWVLCKDARYRPIEPGTCPLADGPPALVGRLRGYGNAIVAPVAEAFIRSAMEGLGL